MNNLDIDCVSLMADYYQLDFQEMTKKISEVRCVNLFVLFYYLYISCAVELQQYNCNLPSSLAAETKWKKTRNSATVSTTIYSPSTGNSAIWQRMLLHKEKIN